MEILYWIDTNINHGFIEKYFSDFMPHWLWKHTCYAFCYWVHVKLEGEDNDF